MQEIVKKTLVTNGTGPFRYYRIPGMVVTAKGTIITYFEMRESGSDWSVRAIGMRRSEDGGETWSSLRTIASTDGAVAVNNPVMIAAREGRVYFLWQEDYHRGFVQVSDDDGMTFGAPLEITDALRGFETERGCRWDCIAFGPGHGIELEGGSLLVPVWMSNSGERTHGPASVSTIISRDGGRTWEPGEVIHAGDDLVSVNETCAVELSDGRVLLNIRNSSKAQYRAISVSGDGHTGFSTPVYDRALPDPMCFGSITRSRTPTPPYIVFSNCASRACRENNYARLRMKLTLRLSTDDCRSWKYSRLLEETSGYSDVAFSHDGKWIYCFYEQDRDDDMNTQPRYLTFSRVNLEWLSDGDIDNA